MSLAQKIVKIFEQLLDEKGIELPCDDKTEEKERHEGGNVAKLYGREYAKLLEGIEALLSGAECKIHTVTGITDGILSVTETGEITVSSKDLDVAIERNALDAVITANMRRYDTEYKVKD